MKLKLAEIVDLFDELNGRLIDAKSGQRARGVLSHKLSIRAKHILQNELNKKIAEYVKEFEESRMDIFKDMVAEGKGEEKEGTYTITPEYQVEVMEKMGELFNIEKSVEVPKINVGELYNIETEDYWPILLDKLLAKEEKKEEPKSEAPVVPLADEK
jgi:hypothetical protein